MHKSPPLATVQFAQAMAYKTSLTVKTEYPYDLYTQNKKRTILSLKKEPVLHILSNPLESQIIGPCRRASEITLSDVRDAHSNYAKTHLLWASLDVVSRGCS